MTRAPAQARYPLSGAYAGLLNHRRLVVACFLGWFLDAFDQVTLILVLPEIARSFRVSLTAMGLVLTVQSVGRMIGNTSWGWLADRYGRKLTFMVGVIWFAVFSGLSGLAWSYTALLAIQLLFGMGFGGEWTASAALLMETVPERSRAAASSLMMMGYEFGFFAAAGLQALLLAALGWRAMFFIGIAPALLAIFIRVGISESPVWLGRQRARATDRTDGRRPARARLVLGFATIQACAFMLLVQFDTASIYSFYPTVLKTAHHFDATFVFYAIATYSAGSILGKLLGGWLSTRFGQRVTLMLYLAITVAFIVPFVSGASTTLLLGSAFLVGGASSGMFALVPDYLAIRFASDVRSFGMGVAYAVAAFGAAISGYVVPALGGVTGLETAIAALAIGASVVVAAIIVREPAELPGLHMREAAG